MKIPFQFITLLAISSTIAAVPESAFRPPPEFSEDYGTFRSPLIFDDGSRVSSADEWPRRRGEILAYWHGVMGAWPPLLDAPAIKTLREGRRENFTQRRVAIDTAPNRTQDGWLLIPDGAGPFPAVLVVYYEPETSVALNAPEKHSSRDYGIQLARRGFVTLSIGTPGGDAWKPDIAGAQCQPLSFHAYVAANCWKALASNPSVDPARIGIVGHSYGGKWSLFAGALWDKFACVVVSDPGIVWDEKRGNVNYWEPWYLGYDATTKRPKPGIPSPENPRTGAYARLVKDGRDLTDLHALIAPRPFLVSGGSEDPPERWIALNHAIAVNTLLGKPDRVAMTNRPAHSPDEESNAVVWAFFERALKTR
ncbi:MAG: hypothetical protein RL088_2281 [Verrucomicrobiota bacterium]|jgi:dienelactone hydrolase